MNTDSFVAPVWQLPVNSEGIVPRTVKYHCFEDNVSLCGRISQDTSFFDDGITCTSAEIVEGSHLACKRCFTKWKRIYQVEE